MKKRKKRYVIIMMILVCIIFFVMNFTKYDFLQEDLLFFQFLNSKSQSEDISQTEKKVMEENIQKVEASSIHIKTIEFDVQYQNSTMKALNLADTVDNQTLVYEKIAPGTSGKFDIVLHSNQNMNYQIAFESKNEKPTHLQFYTLGDGKKYATLEELGKHLMGKILENEEKIIPIYWEWGYETNTEQNIQDTLDAKKMREYDFLIYVQGY